jgi:hypothetical protein
MQQARTKYDRYNAEQTVSHLRRAQNNVSYWHTSSLTAEAAPQSRAAQIPAPQRPKTNNRLEKKNGIVRNSVPQAAMVRCLNGRRTGAPLLHDANSLRSSKNVAAHLVFFSK